MLETLTHDSFGRQLHTHVQVEDGAARSAAVELVEGRVAPAPPGYEAFATVFRGPSDPLLPQGTHRFQHSAIGTSDQFSMRIRWEQHRLYSEAVFNRRRMEGHV